MWIFSLRTLQIHIYQANALAIYEWGMEQYSTWVGEQVLVKVRRANHVI